MFFFPGVTGDTARYKLDNLPEGAQTALQVTLFAEPKVCFTFHTCTRELQRVNEIFVRVFTGGGKSVLILFTALKMAYRRAQIKKLSLIGGPFRVGKIILAGPYKETINALEDALRPSITCALHRVGPAPAAHFRALHLIKSLGYWAAQSLLRPSLVIA